MESKLEVLKDPKQDIKFWLDALNNPNVDRESKELLNKCLHSEINNYLFPIHKIVYGNPSDLKINIR